MLRFTPILLAILYALVLFRFSVWRQARELDARSTLLADREIARVTARLADALGVDRIPVHIYEIEPVNGLAVADGRIFITRGFYRKYLEGLVSAEEMAGVVAHEMGHVALGHIRRRMIDFSGQNAIRAALIMVLSRFIPGLGIYIANFLTMLLITRLTRGDEFEADAYAAALMTKAGLGVGPQITLFRKLEGLSGARGAGMPAWMMTHPKVEDRIAAIEKLASRWGANPALPGPGRGTTET